MLCIFMLEVLALQLLGQLADKLNKNVLPLVLIPFLHHEIIMPMPIIIIAIALVKVVKHSHLLEFGAAIFYGSYYLS